MRHFKKQLCIFYMAEANIQPLRQIAVTVPQCNKWLLQVRRVTVKLLLQKKKQQAQLCFGFQQQISDNSDRQLIVGVCPLLIIHAVCLSHSQTRGVLLFQRV